MSAVVKRRHRTERPDYKPLYLATLRILAEQNRETEAMATTLTITQERCDQLLAELRRYRESAGLPGLGWDCRACGAFNGSAKEELTACRCCDAPRPT